MCCLSPLFVISVPTPITCNRITQTRDHAEGFPSPPLPAAALRVLLSVRDKTPSAVSSLVDAHRPLMFVLVRAVEIRRIRDYYLN